MHLMRWRLHDEFHTNVTNLRYFDRPEFKKIEQKIPNFLLLFI